MSQEPHPHYGAGAEVADAEAHVEDPGRARAPSGAGEGEAAPTCDQGVQAAVLVRVREVAGLHRVLQLVGANSFLLVVSLLAAVAQVLVALKRPLVQSLVVSSLARQADFRRHAWRLLIIMALEKVLAFAQEYFRDLAMDGLERSLELALLEALLRQDARHFDLHAPSALAGRLHGDVKEARRFVGTLASGALGSALSVLGGLHEVYKASPALMAQMGAFLVPCGLYFVLLLSANSQAQRSLGEAAEQRHAGLTETLTNIRTVHSCSAEEQELAKYGRRTDAMVGAALWGRRLGHALRSSYELVVGGLQVFLLYAGAGLVQSGAATEAEAAALSQHVFQVMGATGRLVGMTGGLASGLAALQSIGRELERRPAVPNEGMELGEGAVAGSVELRDVYFQYPARSADEVLQGAAALIPAGNRQPKTYPHPPTPAAGLFSVLLCVFGVFFHLGKSRSRGRG